MNISDNKFIRLLIEIKDYTHGETLKKIITIYAETKNLNKIRNFIRGCIKSKPEEGEKARIRYGKSFETEIDKIEKIIKDC